MCLIIVRDTGVKLPINLLLNGYQDNPNGWGIMYAKNGKIEIRKGLQKELFLNTIDELGDQAMVVHNRGGHQNNINVANCHPFKVTDNVFLMHNGYIDVPITKPQMSDTWHYSRYHLRYQITGQETLLDDADFIDQLGIDIGFHNKIALLRNDGKVAVVNEVRWTSWKGLLLSNDISTPGNHTPNALERRNTIFTGAKTEKKSIEPQLKIENTSELFAGFLIRTPEYFGLDPRVALIYLTMNQKIAKGHVFKGGEQKYWESCRASVSKSIQKLDFKDDGELQDWCTVLQKDFENRNASVCSEEQLDDASEQLLLLPKTINKPTTAPPRSKSVLAGNNNGVHKCEVCSVNFATEKMWFTDTQFIIPLHKDRPGTCDNCYNATSFTQASTTTAIVQAVGVYSHYTPTKYVATIHWHCTVCNDPGYSTNNWSPESTKEVPICYSCVFKEKNKAKRMLAHENAVFCGITDTTTMSKFEINYWSKKSFFKSPDEVRHANAV